MPKMNLGYLIKLASDKLRIRGDEDLKKFGLTFAQSRVLAYLTDREDGQALQKDIETALEVSHPTVVGLITRMEREGFLTTEQDPTDRRNKVVKLTEKAYRVSDELEQMVEQNDERITRSLSEEQKKQLSEMLLVICRNLTDGSR